MALGNSRFASMSSGLLLDPLPSPSADHPTNGKPYTPFPSPDHHVTKARYITSNDPRGYIPVYEYPLNGQWIMLDMDDGYILWTGIWKALGNSKADIVKIIDSQPDLAAQLRRVRGGYLKIQGTWMPYEIALRLSRRVAWPIRYDLVPLFGPTFPSSCLPPDDPGFGQIAKPGTGKRRARRNPPTEMPLDSKHDWTVFSPGEPGPPSMGPPSSRSTLVMSHTFATQPGRHIDAISGHGGHGQSDSPVILHVPYVERPHLSPTSSTSNGFLHGIAARKLSPTLDSAGLRYSPYPSPLSSTSSRFSASSQGTMELSPTSSQRSVGETIKLPPICPPSRRGSEDRGSFQLPPISSMDNLREAQCGEPMAVLRRLQSPDEDEDVDMDRDPHPRAQARRALSSEHLAQRRHSLTAELLHKSSEPSFSSRNSTPRSPASALAALPSSSSSSSSYLSQSRHEHDHYQSRSAVDAPPSSYRFPDFDSHGARRASHDDRPTRSVSPSSYPGSSRDQGDHDRFDEREHTTREQTYRRQERPPSPPRSTSSESAKAESVSPAESAKSGWRPW
ncbi:hypothetical protein V8D89_001741 [Ganoderma adspersum]